MTAPKLVILKRMLLIQGKVRPCCHVQIMLDPATKAVVEEHFLSEALFKRSAYSQNWPQGAIQIPAALAPAMSAFLKNDACPEITVKTMLLGQMHQASNVWEMMCFELAAKLSFDNFLALATTVAELNSNVIYAGRGHMVNAEALAFDADMSAELGAMGTELAA
ncbi:MAG: hypothetical protein K2X41_11950 [Hyphomicrobium sp.]|nr:hypothetical protein [Hyphomicrobium sp.]